MKKKRILFVCKFNITRSQMARALFEKLNKNKNVEVDSAGIIRAERSPELKNATKDVFRNHGLKFKKPKYLESKVLWNQDEIIIVADDVPESLFDPQKKHGIKVTRLNVKDGHKYSVKTKKEKFEKIYSDIERRIKKLVKDNEKC